MARSRWRNIGRSTQTLNIAGQPIGAGAFWDATRRLLVDFRDRRLAEMDANGIELAILGLNSPALQAILDPAEASDVARRANDILAAEIAQSPGRFAGFAGLPMQDPEAAARELTRCVTELGFKGAMVNCFTQRHVPDLAIYYDLPEFRPFWATVAKLDVPFYLHPPSDHPVAGEVLRRASLALQPGLGFRQRNRDSGAAPDRLRTVRRIPGLQVVLGHLGERIPFDMWRIDNLMDKLPVKYPAKKRVSDYMRSNFHLTTSGQFHDTPFHCALAEMGASRIMFSVDYPYEEMAPAAQWFDNTALSDADRLPHWADQRDQVV